MFIEKVTALLTSSQDLVFSFSWDVILSQLRTLILDFI
ncbi:hypothetical protein LINPERPRIM_LOCUS17520 [Linum perenne]